MTTSQLQIIVLSGVTLLVVIVMLPYYLKSRRLLQKYWLRPCTGRDWKRRFPEIPKKDIRDFLEVFVDGFAFSSKKRLKFNPDDKVMDVYRASNLTPGWPDALEFETFARNLERKYGFDLAKVLDEDITLGRIFEMTRKNSQQEHQPDAD
jgi:propanediol dehydratase small subunit